MSVTSGRLLCLWVRAAAVAAVLLAWSGAPAAAQKGPVVTAVEFQGVKRVTPAFLRSQLRTQVGKPFSDLEVSEDIKRLARLGYFSGVRAERVDVLGGVKVVFHLVENQLLRSLKFRGNKEFDAEELQKLVRLAPGRPFARFQVNIDQDRLRESYREKGYMFVAVSHTVVPIGSALEVTYVIDEGPRVSLEEIHFKGNRTFSASKIRKVMQTDDSGWFSTEHFREQTFAEDLVAIKNFYRSKGFLDVGAQLADVKFSPDKSEMEITIAVEEGRRYRVSRIVIAGNHLFPRKWIEKRLSLQEGSFFDQEKILADKKAIEEMYKVNSFLDATAEPSYLYDKRGPAVTLVYKIQEGGKVRVGRIPVRGNTTTKDIVIRRELEAIPGEHYNVKHISESLRKLRNLGYFERINIDIAQDKSPERDLGFDAVEGRTGAIRFAAGITSNSGFVGDVSIRKRNFDVTNVPRSFSDFFSGRAFSGGGQYIILQAQPGTRFNRFRIGFQEPYLFGTENTFGINLFLSDHKRESFDEKRRGLNVSLGRRFLKDYHVELTYRFDVTEIKDVDVFAPSLVRRARGRHEISSLGVNFTIDKRDDFIVPAEGYLLSFGYELAGVVFGGEFDFSRFGVRGRKFFTLYETDAGNKHVLAFGFRYGGIEEHLGTEDVLITERFFAGGHGSLRGFEFRGIGPREGFDPIGGTILVLGNVEYSFPIYRKVLRFVVFGDAGTLALKYDSDDFKKNYRVSVGFGLRIAIPFLGPRPFEIDFGFPVREFDGDEKQVVSFSFGRAF